MDGKGANITDAEWSIMSFLWTRASATVAEIAEEMLYGPDISKRTLKALLVRLVNKGAVGVTVDPRDSRLYHYRAVISREEAIGGKKRLILGTVFDNNSMELPSHFIKDSELSPQDLDELRDILEQQRRLGGRGECDEC